MPIPFHGAILFLNRSTDMVIINILMERLSSVNASRPPLAGVQIEGNGGFHLEVPNWHLKIHSPCPSSTLIPQRTRANTQGRSYSAVPPGPGWGPRRQDSGRASTRRGSSARRSRRMSSGHLGRSLGPSPRVGEDRHRGCTPQQHWGPRHRRVGARFVFR